MSQLNPSEISSVLKDKIAGLDLKATTKNEGTIVNVSDGIIRIHGMGDVMYGEIPPYSVVVSGSMPSKNGINLYCAVIVKRVDEKTRGKTGINELLRD